MQDCEHKKSLCDCIDWRKGDLDSEISHIKNHFEFTKYELEYTTLEPEEGRRICTIGRCRVCGKLLCIGLGLPDQIPVDTLLMNLYQWLYVKLVIPGIMPLDGADCFQDVFVSLFHESDREFVYEWLDRNTEETCGQPFGEGS